jgi:ribonuclease HI
VKLNWDAAIDKEKKIMGVGVVVRDYSGGVIAMKCLTCSYICEPVVVEAMAVWTASKLVGLLGFKDIILKGDSLEIVQEVRREERSWSNFGNMRRNEEDVSYLSFLENSTCAANGE